MSTHEIPRRSMKSTRQVELENTFADLERRWAAFNAGESSETLQELVAATKYFEGEIGRESVSRR